MSIAAAVTVTDAMIAFPFAYFMARGCATAHPGSAIRARAPATVGSVPGRVYAWRLIQQADGLLNWALKKVGLPWAGIAYSNTAMWIVFSYIWLPFSDPPGIRGARAHPTRTSRPRAIWAPGSRTLRAVILPLVLPGIVAGSIFTFSLTLGDQHHAGLDRRSVESQFIGNVVYDAVNQSSNLPFGAAFAVVPVFVMGVYLVIARRLGAFDALMETRSTRIGLGIWVALVLAFLHPGRGHLPLRVQLLERAELADRRA